MSFPRYAEYKESEAELLGDVPTHWRATRLRWLSSRYAGGTPSKDREDYWTDGTIPWINSGAVNDGLIREPSAYITQSAYDSSSAKWIPSGALVMALAGQGKTKGTVAQLALRTTCNQSMAAIVPTREVDARFLYWWLSSNYENIRNMSGGDLRDGLNLEILGNIPCPVFGRHEQLCIATFLDRETAKIDALVAEQERLIALLKEKRQALISHVVTKGLDPNVPMKDTGIEWLGQVPAHWLIVKASRHFAAQKGSEAAQLTKEYCATIEGDYPVYSGQTENGGVMSMIDRYEFDAGEQGCLFSTTVGAKAMSVMHVKDKFSLSQNCMVIVPKNDDVNVRYFFYELQPLFSYERALIATHMQASFRMEDFYQYRFAMPPADEQVLIARHLDEGTKRLDELSGEADRAIALLKERRSALISAAVTGQIDVR